ncbi:sulfotransferase [Elysia marginata]|uniref:Sulfotransferase n=1 Tax=Elysia marginata TaxID=1093978 RepID=A0AAV4FSS0_9GAST|nr:sulfotransferase [Elysia marginata]
MPSSPPPLNVTRNPCWWDKDGLLQCLPYFYIIGFSKCATSDMFSNLVWHPNIISSQKEPHWVDYLRFTDDRRFLQNYTKMFDGIIRKIEMKVLSSGYSNYIFDMWAVYEILLEILENCFTLGFQCNGPDLYLSRVTLYSRYLSWRMKLPHPAYQRPSPEAFHNLCVGAVKLYTKCFQQKSPRQCAYNGTLYTQVVMFL